MPANFERLVPPPCNVRPLPEFTANTSIALSNPVGDNRESWVHSLLQQSPAACPWTSIRSQSVSQPAGIRLTNSGLPRRRSGNDAGLRGRYPPLCVGRGPQRGPEAVSAAVHGDAEPGSVITPTWPPLQKRARWTTARVLPVTQKHMASSWLLTYPQCTAWTVGKATATQKGQKG